MDIDKREHKTPEFLALNPRGRVPALTDGDTIIYESIAILAFLESKHPQPPLFGTTPLETGHIWQRIFEIENYVRSPTDNGLVSPIFQGRAVDAAEEIRAAVPQGHEALKWVDDILSRVPYLAGETLTAADLTYLPTVQRLIRAAGRDDVGPLNLGVLPIGKTYPNIAAWLKRIETLPGYDKTYPPSWRE